MQRRTFMRSATASFSIAALGLVGCTMTRDQAPTAATDMSKRQSIDASVDGTISRVYSAVPGSRELIAKSQGMLVFPSVVEVGFVVGGQYGEGALRVGGTSVGYYSTVSAAFGFLAGAQSKALVFLFLTQDALNQFRQSKGWTAGADASVAVVKVGANGSVDTTTATAPVQVIALTNAGLMGNLSLEGTKVSPLAI
ncbi:BPSL1445 family SYLF domain-containing lipoprotein [Caballeronia terrestris]|uniref:BPSL1445 family SYLF domain-containing lipoprotein n=1 Tax=Caballeronia terrestris TaxID=1226301 RepID=UPI000B3EC1ED|nr:YSC84-related protein [Caballeronia terrestris]